jgi:hypothetical protein
MPGISGETIHDKIIECVEAVLDPADALPNPFVVMAGLRPGHPRLCLK